MGKADLHIHTSYSNDGTASVPAILEQAAHHAKLDIIAITDHDSMEGIYEALLLAPHYKIEVIPGCEISTAEGHLIGLFIQKLVKPGLSLIETVYEIWKQGGICIVPHPNAPFVDSINTKILRNALAIPAVRETILGLETINAGLPFRHSNITAPAIASELNMTPVSSSDSHLVWTIGTGQTIFPGQSICDLRTALSKGNTKAVNKMHPHAGYFLYSHVIRRLLRSLGYVTWIPYPNGEFSLRRLSKLHPPQIAYKQSTASNF